MERKYFGINEGNAKVAHDMMSFRDYKTGSTTADYTAACDEVYDLAEKVAANYPRQAERAEYLAQKYARKLAEYINRDNAIGMMCPSVMISGAGNFPTRKKAKQNAAWERNHELYQYIEEIKDKIRGLWRADKIIKSGEADAIERLEEKLADRKELQEKMREANKAIRMKDIEAGNEALALLGFSEKLIKTLRTPDFAGRVGYPSYELSNNNAEIHRLEQRLESLKAAKEKESTEKEYDGFRVVENTENMRIQIFFDSIPDPEIRDILKHHGFKWAPSQEAWQRQLTTNGKYALKGVLEKLENMAV